MHRQANVEDDLFCLATGPDFTYKLYQSFDVNGYRFHTISRDKTMGTQSSGVLCIGDNNSSDKEYYGFIEEIWELSYIGSKFLYLFKCEWYDVRRPGVGYKVDRYGITSVNLARRLPTNEPFILANQAEQIFYISDPRDSNWAIVMKTHPRDVFNIPACNHDPNDRLILDDDEAYQEEDRDGYAHIDRPLDVHDNIIPLNRDDIGAEELPISFAQEIEGRLSGRSRYDDDFIDDNKDLDTSTEGEPGENELETDTSEDG